MYRFIFSFGLVLATATSASSKSPDEAYYCVAEASGGIRFDEASKSWRGTGFNPTDKFVLNLKEIEVIKLGFDPVERMIVTITAGGSNRAEPCGELGSVSSDPSIVTKYQYISCIAVGKEYFFSRTNPRYLAMYRVGFVNGQDTNDNTPSVTGGTCTRIN